jgi:hypothetical protein
MSSSQTPAGQLLAFLDKYGTSILSAAATFLAYLLVPVAEILGSARLLSLIGALGGLTVLMVVVPRMRTRKVARLLLPGVALGLVLSCWWHIVRFDDAMYEQTYEAGESQETRRLVRGAELKPDIDLELRNIDEWLGFYAMDATRVWTEESIWWNKRLLEASLIVSHLFAVIIFGLLLEALWRFFKAVRRSQSTAAS